MNQSELEFIEEIFKDVVQNNSLPELATSDVVNPQEGTSQDVYDFLTIGILTGLFFIGAPINLAVFFQLTERFPSLNTTDKLKFQLIVSDLLILFVYAVSRICWHISFDWRGGLFLCKVVKFGHEFSFQFSSAILATLALDRCLNVLLSFRPIPALKRRSTLMIYAAWVYSSICSSPQLYRYTLYHFHDGVQARSQCVDKFRIWDYHDQMTHVHATVETYLNWLHIITVFWLPLLIMTISYAIIGRQVWRYYRGDPDPELVGNQIQFQESTHTTDYAHNTLCNPFIEKCRRRSLEGKEKKLQNITSVAFSLPVKENVIQWSILNSQPDNSSGESSGGEKWTELTQIAEIDETEEEAPPEDPSRRDSSVYKFAKVPRQSLESGQLLTARSAAESVVSYNPRRQRRLPIQTLKTTMSLITAYIVCWLPYHVASLWPLFDSSEIGLGRRVSTVLSLLIVGTSVVNPFIYGFFSAGRSDSSCCDLRYCWTELTKKPAPTSVRDSATYTNFRRLNLK